MKHNIFVALMAVCAVFLCGCGVLSDAIPGMAATVTAVPTKAPTATPYITPVLTPTPVPTPDPAVWGVVVYGGAAYNVSLAEIGTDSSGRTTATVLCPDVGENSTYVGGEPVYPFSARIETERGSYDALTLKRDGERFTLVFGTNLPPVMLIVCPSYAPEDEAHSARFDGATLRHVL